VINCLNRLDRFRRPTSTLSTNIGHLELLGATTSPPRPTAFFIVSFSWLIRVSRVGTSVGDAGKTASEVGDTVGKTVRDVGQTVAAVGETVGGLGALPDLECEGSAAQERSDPVVD
jgi:hypothetical protein